MTVALRAATARPCRGLDRDEWCSHNNCDRPRRESMNWATKRHTMVPVAGAGCRNGLAMSKIVITLWVAIAKISTTKGK